LHRYTDPSRANRNDRISEGCRSDRHDATYTDGLPSGYLPAKPSFVQLLHHMAKDLDNTVNLCVEIFGTLETTLEVQYVQFVHG
jgi:hypothetical protein